MVIYRTFVIDPGGMSFSFGTGDLFEYVTTLEDFSLSDNLIRLSDDPGEVARLEGRNFRMSFVDGVPKVTGGTITSITIFADGQKAATFTGLKLSAKAFMAAQLASASGDFLDLIMAPGVRATGSSIGDELQTSSGDDTLDGRGGNDFLLAFAGSDRLIGGRGNDALIGDSPGGSIADSHDVLIGGKGSDQMIGVKGRDTLTGGAGADSFVFDDAGANRADRVTDFLHGTDRIFLEGAFLNPGNLLGVIDPELFHRGAQAAEADDRIIFNPANGRLVFDANGSVAGETFLIAIFNDGANVRAADISFGNPIF